jgi:hypothetical protein
MALYFEQKQLCGIIKEYDDKPEESARNATATENAAFDDWINCEAVARSTIIQWRELMIHREYKVFKNAKMLWEMLASAYKSQLKLNIFQISEDLCSIKLQAMGDVNNYSLWLNPNVRGYKRYPWTFTTDTDAEQDTVKTIMRMSEQEHRFTSFMDSEEIASGNSSGSL